MRRIYTLLIPLVAAGTLAACSSGASSTTSTSASATYVPGSMSTDSDVAVTGLFGKEPTVSIPSAKAGADLYTKTLIQGTGPAVTSTSLTAADYVLYLWDGSSRKLVGNTYGASGSPQDFSAGQSLPGLATALIGKKAGSRVLAIVPPSQAYGKSGNSQEGITGSDTLVFVVDVLGTFASNATVSGTQTQAGADLPTVTAGPSPTVTIPKVAPPSTLTIKPLITGTGPKVQSGQWIIVQYTGVNWRTGKVFDSSWSRKTPFGLEIGQPGGVIVGWDLGLEGQTVGSRILLVIPPADGYGKKGVSEVGIKGTDTLVFVVDILGAYS
jgi:FKBP-type peptidyl-prolyl cis-trans isomerase